MSTSAADTKTIIESATSSLTADTNSALELPKTDSVVLPDQDKKKCQEFIDFRNKILTWELKTNTGKSWGFTGNRFLSGWWTLFESIQSPLPDWLTKEENLIEIFVLLAQKKAFKDFETLFIQYEEGRKGKENVLDLLSIIEKQDKAFFDICGQYLLICAILERNPKLIRYLIVDKDISPVFDIEQTQYTTPLFSLIRHYHGEEKEWCEFLDIFVSRGCNVNQPNLIHEVAHYYLYSAANSLYFNRLPIMVFQKILELGANPFACRKGYEHALNEAYRINRSAGVELLLNYGAGLIRNERRLEPSNTGRDEMIEAEFIPHCTKNALTTHEIVFRDCLENKWIYTVKELAELLNRYDNFTFQDKKRIDLICRNVLNNADPDILADGVINAFRNYYQARKAPLLLSAESLAHQLTTGPLKIILGYLDSDEDLVKETLKPKV